MAPSDSNIVTTSLRSEVEILKSWLLNNCWHWVYRNQPCLVWQDLWEYKTNEDVRQSKNGKHYETTSRNCLWTFALSQVMLRLTQSIFALRSPFITESQLMNKSQIAARISSVKQEVMIRGGGGAAEASFSNKGAHFLDFRMMHVIQNNRLICTTDAGDRTPHTQPTWLFVKWTAKEW